MKHLYTALFCLLVIAPKIGTAEPIEDATLKRYYEAGKAAYEKHDWINALKYFFTYQELNSINTSKNSTLIQQDVESFIQYSIGKLKISRAPNGPVFTIDSSSFPIVSKQPKEPVASRHPVLIDQIKIPAKQQ